MHFTYPLFIGIASVVLTTNLYAQAGDGTAVTLFSNRALQPGDVSSGSIPATPYLRGGNEDANIAAAYSPGDIYNSPNAGKRSDRQWEYEDMNADKVSGFNLAISTTAWVFSGNLAALQRPVLPGLGLLAGGRVNKLTFDFSCNFWSTYAPRTMTIYKNDSSLSARYHTGAYIGLDAGYQVYRRKRWEVDGILGIGDNLFGAYYDNSDILYFHTLDVNVGVGYRFYIRYRDYGYQKVYSYLALQTKVHLLNYNNPGGTAINGNAFSITLEYGGYWHNYRNKGADWRSPGAGGSLWNSFWDALSRTHYKKK